jgi:hypothetical protein
MAIKKHTKEKAIQFCLDQITSKKLEQTEFNKLRQYKVRYKAGKLSEIGIQTLFKRFGVQEHCYYTIPKIEE